MLTFLLVVSTAITFVAVLVFAGTFLAAAGAAT
jgi:hypothetical protein